MADTSLIFNIIARDKTGSTFDKIKTGAAVAGAAIGAVLMSSISAAIDKGKIDNKLAAQLGATPAQAKMLGKLSGSVYAQGFGEDMPQVAAAIKAAGQNGLIDIKTATAETAAVATKNLLTVGNVLEEDSDRVASAVQQMLRTGLADSSEEAMDILVKATQAGVNKSGDLLDTVNEYGTQFRKLGLDGPTSMGLLSQAIKGGARDADTAADALKELSIRAVDGSKTSAQGFKLAGLDAKEMTAKFAAGGDSAAEAFSDTLEAIKKIKDPVKQNAAAVALFGTKAEDLGQSLFAMDMGDAADQMKDFKGATNQAATTAANGVASWGNLGRQFQMAIIDKLNVMLPIVNKVFGFFERNSQWLGPLATGLGVLGVAIGIITAAQWAWNAALALSPVTWIIAGIVALVAVIVIVATKTKFFQTIWNAVWGFMKGVGAWFAGPFAGFFVSLWNKLVLGFNIVKDKIGSAINSVKDFFNRWGQASVIVKDRIVNGLTNMVNFIKGIPGKIRSALSNLFAPLWNGFKGFINKLISGWNSLHFGIPGFSFAGIKVPGVEVGVPRLPMLDKGGHVTAEGMAYIHRGETVTPTAKVTPYRGGNGEAHATLTLKSDGSRLMNLLLEILREAIRDKGGDPVKVLTPA